MAAARHPPKRLRTPPAHPASRSERPSTSCCSTIDCGRVEAQASTAAPARLALTGHVADAAARARLLDGLAALPGVEAVDPAGLVLLPRPYCTVVDRLAATGTPLSDEQEATIPRIGQAGQAGLLRYSDGQAIEIRIEAPSFEAHLHIAYVGRDGSVLHLMPNDRVPDRLIPADARIVLGGAEGEGYRMQAAPPYGLDLVLAVASDGPLFDGLRPQGESIETFLADLEPAVRQRLATGGRVEWAYLLIETVAP